MPEGSGGSLFYTLLNLQGSQTGAFAEWMPFPFYTLLNLQGSQTFENVIPRIASFTLFLTYKVLKQSPTRKDLQRSFTLFLTYKVLKPDMGFDISVDSFTLFLTYKVLKPQIYL